MTSSTVFTKSVLKTKKTSRIKLLFLVLGKIIKNNPIFFFFCSLLAVITAIINFNIGVTFKDAFFVEEKRLSTQVVKAIERSNKKEEEIEKQKIREILQKKYDKNDERQEELKKKIEQEISGEGKINKKKIVEKIKTASTGVRSVINTKDFRFKFNFFGKNLFEWNDLNVWQFVGCTLILIFIAKAFFSLLHYYLMSYSQDSIEKGLKKDLFAHFIRAKYHNSSEVAQNLIGQFASDLDEISRNIWFIPNRLIYVLTSMLYHVFFDFNFGSAGVNWEFIAVLMSLFVVLIIIEFTLFKRAAKLNVAAKKRYEADNKVIYERINNLEYIKTVSGEKYEEEKISKQLDATFQKNKKSLWFSVLFKALPGYLMIPNIPIFFVSLTLVFFAHDPNDPRFYLVNFIRYYFAAQKLNGEMNKAIDSLVGLDELSSNMTFVNESAKILNRKSVGTITIPEVATKKVPFKNGDIIFQDVVFAYPKRFYRDILRNFSFRFEQGKIYGIAGKNGIGKSTITKTTLKLYDLKEGQILIGKRNVQEIDTLSLHQRVCYQTNRPSFFRMSIAENVYYPYKYEKKDHEKLVYAAKKTGIYEFISKLPMGFDTELKEGGTDLSEGQKQQILAMKIFIRNYDIYILDEILSNVHPVLKETILTNIFSKIKGKTTLVIDHHYKIFQYVDYVYQFTGEKLIKMKKKDFTG